MANVLRFVPPESSSDAARLDELRELLISVTTTGSLAGALEALARWVERSTSALCAINLVDRERQRLVFGAAPSLPAAFNAACNDLPIADGVGSCGSAAATRQPVFVTDIGVDPRWAPYRDLAAPHGLVACWSQPILDAHGDGLGTFALYHQTPAAPSAGERLLLEDAARVAALVIERAHTDAAREAAERARHQMALRLRRVADAVEDLILVVDAADGTIRFANATATMQSADGVPWEGRRLSDELFGGVVDPEDAGRLVAFLCSAMHDENPDAIVVRHRQPDGIVRHVRCRHVVLERDTTGRPARVLFVGSRVPGGRDAADGRAPGPHASPKDDGDGPAARLRGIRVLVVDDEPDVLRVVAKRLQRAGCHIDTSTDGEDALQRVLEAPNHWHVLLTDQTMPRRTGEQLLVAIREAGIPIPVVVMSGYSATVTPDRMLAAGASAFLPKPFDGAQLLATIAGALAR